MAITVTTWRWVEPLSISSARPSPRLAVFDVAPAAPDPAPPPPPQEPRPPSKAETARSPAAAPLPVAAVRSTTVAAEPNRPAPPAPPGIAIVTSPAPSPPVAAPSPAVRPVTASAPASERSARVNWQGALLAHLKPLLRYPRMAQGAGQQGVTTVAVTVERSGAIRSVRVAHGSGYPVLDQEAVATVRRGAPLPPPTADILGDPVAVELPIQFSLRG
jgi:protein TonB